MAVISFDEAMSSGASRRSLMDPGKLRFLYDNAVKTSHVQGAIAEIGVYRGGSALLLRAVCPGKILHLFDTFRGIPEKTAPDVHNINDFRDTNVDDVKGLFGDSAIFHVGVFQDVVAKTFGMWASVKFSMVHIDADQYATTKFAIEFFHDKMAEGGVIVFDDYKFYNCPGVLMATDEFYSDKKNNKRPQGNQLAVDY